MPSILFRGSRIRYADLRSEEAGIYARLHLQADLSTPVLEAMGWDEIPECFSTAKLTGKISAHALVLTPNDRALAHHEIQMECGDIGDFAIVPEKDDDGEIQNHRLNFIARTVQPGAIALAENYMRVCGGADATCKVTYEKQEALPLQPGTKLDTGETATNASAPSSFSTGIETGEHQEYDAPLPTAVHMAGSTENLKRQRRARQPKGTPIPTDPGAPEWRTADEIADGVPHHIDAAELGGIQ